ncbi:universal stress protein [Hydromonas duriensis]|uniref:Nucleotide-binding universal stress UspA family protein n=1 Tax=Hydromonas duriensis TaxID=1527608 RepID=A0A4R6Y392_9BURK|nr:universal stress protein [Hydromonas duriensis]TDR30825.1 nucleotide-binding universal stress UspA family protein [Hydromonas duriensis]
MKTCLVGYTPDYAGQEALALARMMTATSGSNLVVCTVVPEVWGHPSLAPVDKEYGDFLAQHAQATLDKARAQLADVANVRYIKFGASSATVGLTQAAKQEGADIIVLGSSRDGSSGRLSVGGVAGEIMHLAEVPIAMAPRDFRVKLGTQLPRLTCAYSGSEEASGTVLEALGIATELGVSLRLVSFAVRDRQMYPSLIGYQAEKEVQAAWREQARVSLERVCKQLAGHEPAIEIDVAEGETWEDALSSIEWEAGEVLALGSSRMGVLQRVFLGSNAKKIMKASPVPVMVLPRAS